MVRLEKENEILRRRLAESDTITVGGGGGKEVTTKDPSQERGPLVRGTGGERMVAALQKQLQDKHQRISQLEAVAQESSQFNTIYSN